MNNLEVHALFQAEEEALQQAFQRHDLIGRDYNQEGLLAFPSLLQDVFKFPDDVLCQKLKTQIDAGAEIDATLAEKGIDDNERNLRNKVSWGKFTAGFLLQCLSALGCSSLHLE